MDISVTIVVASLCAMAPMLAEQPYLVMNIAFQQNPVGHI